MNRGESALYWPLISIKSLLDSNVFAEALQRVCSGCVGVLINFKMDSL